jgi:enoyl-CoA hydratase
VERGSNPVSDEPLNLQKTGPVVVVRIGDLTDDSSKVVRLRDELMEVCQQISADQDARVVILTGTGEKTFCLGTDLSGVDSEDQDEFRVRVLSLSESISKIDLPVIGAINGDAIGQGLELVLSCDIRIATETSCFGMTQIKTGLIPWDGGTQRLARLVGRGKALEMILTGEVIDAQEAYRIGLVNKVVPPDQLMAIAMSMAQEMASKGPIALRYTKEAVYKGMDLTLEQGLRLEADLYLLLHTTKDRTEGIKAFLEKRTPRFEGR